MNKTVIGSTKIGYELPLEEAKKLSGLEAGFCYMPDDTATLLAEEPDSSIKRANGTMKSGHHSVFDHVSYNFALNDIPKILAMFLNNEKVYGTSEKSARYTKMQPSPEEKELYEKWIELFKVEIDKVYPFVEGEKPEKRAKTVEKKAMENARYLISVFTPATSMGHTLQLRQLNYILEWSEEFIANAEDTEFNKKLKKVFEEFVPMFDNLRERDINTIPKERKFSLIAGRSRKEEWGETYCTNYKGTFTELAQAQRHRTLWYEMSLLEEPEFYVPPIIAGTELEKEWLKDISSLAANFPQGMLVQINERGTVENFVLKTMERLCGEAQLEIALQTNETLKKYMENTKDTNPEVYNYLLPYSKGARCTFPCFKCQRQCAWGPKNALNRLV